MEGWTSATEGKDWEAGRRFGRDYSSCDQHSNQILGTCVGVTDFC